MLGKRFDILEKEVLVIKEQVQNMKKKKFF
jgi:hypothetical protein